MKTPLRLFFVFLFFIGFNPFSSQAIIRSKLDTPQASKVSTPPIIKEKPKSIKQRISNYLLKKISSTSVVKDKKTKSTRVLNIVLITFFSLVAIYLLQGTFWLTVVALLGFSIFQFRKWKRNKPTQPPLVTKGNHYSKKSLKAFLIGLSSLLLAFLAFILLILSEAAGFTVALFFGLGLLGIIFLSLAFARAIKSIRIKEEDNISATIVLVLSILLLLPIIIFLLGALIFGG